MQKIHGLGAAWLGAMVLLSSACATKNRTIPGNTNNLVAYYAFDATPVNQSKMRLSEFTDQANIVVVFEGTIFELGDPARYGNPSAYILNVKDGPYTNYQQIIDDIHLLQDRGIMVLMNVDDAESWQTTTPFVDYKGDGKTYKEYAALVHEMAKAVPFDGIALDVEHFSGPANGNYVNLIRELGRYFGPKSKNPDTTIYTAAIYSAAQAGDAIGKDPETAAYFNFVEDMGYFMDDRKRFSQYADVIGADKVMAGMSHQNNTLDRALDYCAWAPSIGPKAGVMVFAGNVNKEYTDTILSAITSGASNRVSRF